MVQVKRKLEVKKNQTHVVWYYALYYINVSLWHVLSLQEHDVMLLLVQIGGLFSLLSI